MSINLYPLLFFIPRLSYFPKFKYHNNAELNTMSSLFSHKRSLNILTHFLKITYNFTNCCTKNKKTMESPKGSQMIHILKFIYFSFKYLLYKPLCLKHYIRELDVKRGVFNDFPGSVLKARQIWADLKVCTVKAKTL